MARGKKAEKALTPEERLAQALVSMEEQPYPVPENWCWTTLSYVAVVVTGGTPSKKQPKYYGNAFPFFKPTDLNAGRYVFEATEYLSEEGKAVARLIPANSTAVCCIGSIGKSGYLIVDGTTNQQINSAIPKYNPLYLYYYINTDCFINQLGAKASATTISIVNKSKMEQCFFPLSPLAEQQRIVDRIESLFAKLDEAKEKAQAVVDGFETRKAAILHRAFTGELTAKWRKAHKVGIKSWKYYKYAELGTAKLGKMLDKSKNTGQETKYLRNINVRWFDFDLSDLASMLASNEERRALSVEQGDLFICEGGEPGRCAVWKEHSCELIFQKALHRFRPNHRSINGFLCYNLYYMSLNGSLEQHFTGSTIKHLTGQSLAKIEILLPCIEEQIEIVRILDNLLAKEQQAKEAAEAVIGQIDTMKKSILARAFRGELGTNDPVEESAANLLSQYFHGGGIANGA